MKRKTIVNPVNVGSRSSNTIIKLDLSTTKHSPSVSPSPVPKKSRNAGITPTNKDTKDFTIKSANITPRRDHSSIDLSYSPIRDKDAFETNNLDNSINNSTNINNPPAPSSNINVTCRFRPLNEKEKKLTNDLCVEFNSENCILIKSSVKILLNQSENNTYNFSFDRVFDCDAKQEDIYQFAGKPIVECIFEGFNGTIFAYGQTSSGKTFTMQGVLGDENYEGIIPRINKHVFEKITSKKDNQVEFSVIVSMIEIYMEKIKVKFPIIKDLLKPNNNNLNIREDKVKGIYIEDLSEEKVSSIDEVFELMKIGNDNRSIGKTNMNEHSSRSHSIFMMQVSQKNLIDLSVKTGKLYLVDLAGSEKISKTGVSGQLLEEAKTINKSLTSLGMVINALTDGKSGHIPYRESKLTRILQDSLGGNSKTSLIITCSPSNFNEAETLSTVRFGIRAKKIKNKPKINKNVTMTELKAEIVKLEKLLELSKQRVDYLENYISHNNIRLLCIEDKKDESVSVFTTKNSNDNDLYEKIENLTTQVQIEKDIQKQMKKENIQLSINFNEITERYNFIEEQHYILIGEYDQLLDKEKELTRSNDEKDKKLDEYQSNDLKKDKVIQDLVEKNLLLEEQVAKRDLIEAQQKKEEETSFIGVAKNNSIQINVNENKSIIFNDTFCVNNNKPLAFDKTVIVSEQEFFKKLFAIAEKNSELKALFETYPSLTNKSIVEVIQENIQSDKRCSVSNELVRDNSFLTNVQFNASLRTTATKVNNEIEITRFNAKSFTNKPEIDREKIMREIKSSVDSKLKRMKNYKNDVKEEEKKIFESWNLNNFRTRFKFYKHSNDNEKNNKI